MHVMFEWPRSLPLLLVLALGVFCVESAPATTQTSAIFQALDTSSPVTYFLADGAGRTGFRRGDAELATWALRAWQQ
jgi:hypothetical protein